MDDLEDLAWDLGAVVVSGDVPTAFVCLPEEPGQAAVIGIPRDAHGLERYWLLAHELGHLAQHAGPKGPASYGKDEAAADRWAAQALIPERRVRAHGNASLDAFLAALSVHYQDLGDGPERALAARIAGIRLSILGEGAA